MYYLCALRCMLLHWRLVDLTRPTLKENRFFLCQHISIVNSSLSVDRTLCSCLSLVWDLVWLDLGPVLCVLSLLFVPMCTCSSSSVKFQPFSLSLSPSSCLVYEGVCACVCVGGGLSVCLCLSHPLPRLF